MLFAFVSLATQESSESPLRCDEPPSKRQCIGDGPYDNFFASLVDSVDELPSLLPDLAALPLLPLPSKTPVRSVVVHDAMDAPFKSLPPSYEQHAGFMTHPISGNYVLTVVSFCPGIAERADELGEHVYYTDSSCAVVRSHMVNVYSYDRGAIVQLFEECGMEACWLESPCGPLLEVDVSDDRLCWITVSQCGDTALASAIPVGFLQGDTAHKQVFITEEMLLRLPSLVWAEPPRWVPPFALIGAGSGSLVTLTSDNRDIETTGIFGPCEEACTIWLNVEELVSFMNETGPGPRLQPSARFLHFACDAHYGKGSRIVVSSPTRTNTKTRKDGTVPKPYICVQHGALATGAEPVQRLFGENGKTAHNVKRKSCRVKDADVDVCIRATIYLRSFINWEGF